MRFSRFVFLAFFALIAQFASAQQTAPAVQRDPQAVTVMQKSANAMVGSIAALASASQNGILVSGTYQASNDPATGPFPMRVKILGYSQVRWEVDEPDGTYSTIVTPESAWRLGPVGSAPLFLGEIMGKQLEALPFLALEDWVSDPQVTLKYAGTETLDGRQVAHVSVASPFRLDPSGLNQSTLETVSTCDLYLDAASNLPARLRYSEYPRDIRVSVPIELTFSNYQQISGFWIPTVIVRAVYGHAAGEYRIASVALNAAIPPSEFAGH